MYYPNSMYVPDRIWPDYALALPAVIPVYIPIRRSGQCPCRHHFHRGAQRQFPPVDAAFFSKSANSFLFLIKDANLLMDKLAHSKELAAAIMKAAQESNMTEVEKLIKSTGVHSDVKIEYNPDGIHLILSSKVQNIDCCKLIMALRWR